MIQSMKLNWWNNILYTSHYCEENVYKTAETFASHTGTSHENPFQGYVVFISNTARLTPIWKQKLAEEDQPVVWDYHVIFLVKRSGSTDSESSYVIDQDTKLGFPVSFKQYCDESFPSNVVLKPIYRQLFRVIPADVFLKSFASDRSHMVDHKETNRLRIIDCTAPVAYQAPVPVWPIIQGSEANCSMNLDDFISVEVDQTGSAGLGAVLTVEEFIAFA